MSLRRAGDAVASTGSISSSVDVEHEVITCLDRGYGENQTRGNNVRVGITPVVAFDNTWFGAKHGVVSVGLKLLGDAVEAVVQKAPSAVVAAAVFPFYDGWVLGHVPCHAF